METQYWIQIVMIIVTLIGPSLAVLLQEKLVRARTKPKMAQPSVLTKRIALWLISRPAILSFLLIGIIINIVFLIRDLNNPEPPTRMAIFHIALSSGAILFQLLVFMMYDLMSSTIRILDKISGIQERLISSQGEIVSSHGEIVSIMESQKTRPRNRRTKDA